MKLTPYIHFSGNAREVLNFYKDVLGGDIQQLSTYGESPMPCDEDYKDKIMHARLVFDGNMIMISDAFKGQEVAVNGNIQLSVDIGDPDKLDGIFNKMAEGGRISMPLEDTFWGARFGMLRDKFGIDWMFNHQNRSEEEAADKTLDITA